MLNPLYNWFVIQGVNEGVPYFWSTPIGSFSILIILIASLVQIFKGGRDFIDTAYNWVLAIICMIAFLHIYENSNPRHQMMVIVIALAVKKAWATYKLFKRGR